MKNAILVKVILPILCVVVVVSGVVVIVRHNKKAPEVVVLRHNPLLSHVNEVYALIEARTHTEAWYEQEEKGQGFSTGEYIRCYLGKGGEAILKKSGKTAEKQFLNDCRNMAMIQMKYAHSQGKFMKSTLDDWNDQKLLGKLYQKENIELSE